MTVSPNMCAQLQAVDDRSGVLMLVVIEHPALSASVHVLNDTRPRTIGGVPYAAIPMEVTLPTDQARQASQARLEMSNVGRELMAELEGLPLGARLDVTLRLVSRAAPEQIEWEYTAEVGRITATVPRLVIVLGDDTLLGQSAVLMRFDPTTAPGLFAG